MSYGYYNYYNSPLMNYANIFVVLGVAVVLAVILGFLYFSQKKQRRKVQRSKGENL